MGDKKILVCPLFDRENFRKIKADVKEHVSTTFGRDKFNNAMADKIFTKSQTKISLPLDFTSRGESVSAGTAGGSSSTMTTSNPLFRTLADSLDDSRVWI
jgi:hypothetical protein